jgi:hypothetical protein
MALALVVLVSWTLVLIRRARRSTPARSAIPFMGSRDDA